MLNINPQEVGNQESFKYLVGAVSPRPIAFVSTISKDGINNLSPFSFFNIFGSNPPVLVFSPSRRGRDNTLKDTYHNLKETNECVVHIVSYDMIEKMNYASSEFDSDVDEFEKSGFTPIDSKLVKAKRVKESPVHLECKVLEILEIGGKAGSGNLVVCEIINIHVNENVLDEKGHIDPFKLDTIGRNGGNWYTRANGNALFELAKPTGIGIGYDKLPEYIKESDYLTANDIGKLISHNEIPSIDNANKYINQLTKKEFNKVNFEFYERQNDCESMLELLLNEKVNINYFNRVVKVALSQRQVEIAWNVLVYLEGK
jgi:flavin reductase (DIM6/NTAB) family NADH-FMN oxidoreductase RutF